MCRKIVLLSVLLVSAAVLLGAGDGANVPRPIATPGELLQYPLPLYDEGIPLSERLFVVALPESDLAVVIRPITEEEYGSYEVQAIGHEMIEQELLAAAIVLPALCPSDVAGFSAELADYLKGMVNWISGFSVFSGPLSASP